MNRCTPQPRRVQRRLLAGLLAGASALAALPAAAQTAAATPAVRNFPAAALRGELAVTQPPAILLDGKAERLTPGARIHGLDNLLVRPAALVSQTLVVNYLRDGAGQVHEVWLLNSEEAKLKRPNSPSSWFSWGTAAPASTAAATTN